MSDLKALRLFGSYLCRRAIDTQAIFTYAEGARAPLRALVGSMLPKQEWEHFQDGIHSPMVDAEAALQLVLREVRLLMGEPGRTIGRWDGEKCANPKRVAQPGDAEHRLLVPESEVGRLLGKAGAHINGIRQTTTAHIVLPPRGPGSMPTPRVMIVSGSAAAVSAAVQLVKKGCPSVRDQ